MLASFFGLLALSPAFSPPHCEAFVASDFFLFFLFIPSPPPLTSEESVTTSFVDEGARGRGG